MSRWEHDKRPDQFELLLDRLQQAKLEFQLLLAGAQPQQPPPALQRIRDRYASRIVHIGYAETITAYWDLLSQMDVVVSTADHEFFGIAICEAAWAGAVPVVPDRLSYPEIVPAELRYRDLQQAADLIMQLRDRPPRQYLQQLTRQRIESLQMKHTVKQFDDALARLNG